MRADAAPDPTAIRVALWRALHVAHDPPPHVLTDVIGLALANPGDDWRQRPDMDPQGTRPFRASIVARARFLEDLVAAEVHRGIGQYVILGAGLDTFAQRSTLGPSLRIFEIDRPGPQAWKQHRLAELDLAIPAWLRFVPVDFEAGRSWLEPLVAAGFDPHAPAVIASTGVSMYLSREANAATLREVAAFAPGSTLAMTFLLPVELGDPALRPGVERARDGARASGTPFVSFFTPAQMLDLAREAGFREPRHVSADALAERYFAGRPDGLRPPSGGEEILLATT
jgi:methyltransferase (TIGR00027 family)